MNSWSTKELDLRTARSIIEQYAEQYRCEQLGFYELVVDATAKRMDFRLSPWVMRLAEYFKLTYGTEQGEFVTRQVISNYVTRGHTVH